MSSLLGEARVRIRPDLTGFLNDTQRDVSRAGEKAGSAFSKAMKAGVVAFAGITAAAGLAARSTLDIGVSYQNSLNSLQAVSSATASQMAAVSDTAKRLGQDMTLPATSAADAATAMTELAKGGLSVGDAMTAAKGTLQLAAAAQIDAGRAAEYQSNTLNAFSLNADQAGRVADVLANTANAASGEITDFGDAFAQASAVAASAGISLEDTAATLGVLANNGIKGSDAGTLLKSALLALQSPSKPAQQAMDDLSLSAYDAAGNFVGLSSVFGQLSDAQKKMTPEAYAAATSTLFGSDAARLAGIAGKEGAAGFDTMRQAMGRQGAAADVAAAKSKGLGGAIEAFKSQVETFQIDLFERGAPNIEKLVRYAAEHFPEVGKAVMTGIDKAVAFVVDFKDKAVVAFKAVRDYVAPLTTALGKFWHSFTADGGGAESLFNLLKVGAGILLGLFKALKPVMTLLGDAVSIFAKLPGPVQAVVMAFAALKVASKFDVFGGLFGGGAKSSRDSSEGRLRTLGASVQGFAQTVRVNMRLAGDEVGAFQRLTGGLSAGFGTYLPDATDAVTNFRDAVKAAFEQAKQAKQVETANTFGIDPEQITAATGDLAGFRAAAREAASQGMGALRAGASGLVSTLGGPFGVAMAAGSVMVGSFTAQMQEASDTTDKWAQALIHGGAGATQAMKDYQKQRDKEPTQWLADLDEWTGLHSSIDDAKKAAEDYFQSLDPVAEAQARAAQWQATLTEEIANGTPESEKAQAARRRLAYWTDTAASREHLLANEMQTTTAAIHASTQEALAKTNADIAVQMASSSLTTQIDEYRKSLDDSTLSGAEHDAISGQMAQTAISVADAMSAQALAHSTASTEEGKQAEADAALLASLKDTARQLGDATPQAVKDLIASLSGGMAQANWTASAMTNLGLSVDAIPDEKSVIIDAPTAEQAQKLRDLGYQIQTLPNGQVKVTADTSQAHDDLKSLYSWIENLRPAIINSQVKGSGATGGGGTNRHLATGGPVLGPGTATSDSIPAWLSNGEYVVKAKAVAKYGVGFLHAVNAGKFADGGQVGGVTPRLVSPRRSAGSTQDGSFTYAPTFIVDPQNGSVRDQIGDSMFELRRLRRGGRFA